MTYLLFKPTIMFKNWVMHFDRNKRLITLTMITYSSFRSILIVNAFEDYDLWSTTFSFIVVEYVLQMIKRVRIWNFFILCLKSESNDNFQSIGLPIFVRDTQYCLTEHKKTKYIN